ncbi:hypothetical protein ANCCAN_09609 [Ancylostoma caninum]|uniref:Uncharacterized protein n=1 Tax=Ancylostoma caninum TaxID=29170 RepID=A0A368GN22_ANCCA|nr:hypothetical protein ANCCAN_09609 [Ancylostoma caninum]
MAPGSPLYMNNPYSGHSAPSNDIFASPIPNQLRVARGCLWLRRMIRLSMGGYESLTVTCESRMDQKVCFSSTVSKWFWLLTLYFIRSCGYQLMSR